MGLVLESDENSIYFQHPRKLDGSLEFLFWINLKIERFISKKSISRIVIIKSFCVYLKFHTPTKLQKKKKTKIAKNHNPISKCIKCVFNLAAVYFYLLCEFAHKNYLQLVKFALDKLIKVQIMTICCIWLWLHNFESNPYSLVDCTNQTARILKCTLSEFEITKIIRILCYIIILTKISSNTKKFYLRYEYSNAISLVCFTTKKKTSLHLIIRKVRHCHSGNKMQHKRIQHF